uniref:Uncharacterized protein n=1 Tax=Anguilla anguilla TaxID=7936 RepID=A0A0E9P8M8_ANGAN
MIKGVLKLVYRSIINVHKERHPAKNEGPHNNSQGFCCFALRTSRQFGFYSPHSNAFDDSCLQSF